GFQHKYPCNDEEARKIEKKRLAVYNFLTVHWASIRTTNSIKIGFFGNEPTNPMSEALQFKKTILSIIFKLISVCSEKLDSD
ncbi:MAG: hypothetical protein ACTS85_03630, partial [Arsenophonus sp. NC-PG7-MAG3]